MFHHDVFPRRKKGEREVYTVHGNNLYLYNGSNLLKKKNEVFTTSSHVSITLNGCELQSVVQEERSRLVSRLAIACCS